MRAAMQNSGCMKHIHYVAGSHETSAWEVAAGALTGVPSRPLPARRPTMLSPGLLLMTAGTPRNLERSPSGCLRRRTQAIVPVGATARGRGRH